jgi:hypothetical protein
LRRIVHFRVRRRKDGGGRGDALIKTGSKCRLKLDAC